MTYMHIHITYSRQMHTTKLMSVFKHTALNLNNIKTVHIQAFFFLNLVYIR